MTRLELMAVLIPLEELAKTGNIEGFRRVVTRILEEARDYDEEEEDK